MIVFILKNCLRYHIYISIINFIIYEIIKFVYGHKIIENGWAQTPEYTEFSEAQEKKRNSTPYDVLYFLPMIIPFVNLSCTADLIEMILYTPDQVRAMEEEENEGLQN